MTLLVLGILAFAGLHLVKSLAPSLRTGLQRRLGENAYKGIFSLLVLASFAMIIFGWRSATPQFVYQPSPALHMPALVLIMLAFFLLLLLVGGRQSSEASKRSLRLQMELRQLARAEEHARLSAERANAAKSQFLMNMSHELRTPMHAVMAYAQLGVTRCNEPKIRGYLERIHTSASGLLALLGDLLDLARLETGRMEFRIRPKDPLLLVERIAAEFGPQLRHRDVRLEVVAAGELPLVPLDESRVAQVLRNLVANAFRHSPDNGLISIAVGVVAGEQGRELVLRVRDQGVGIPEDELESVFEKFVQSSKTRSGAGGVGLGLAICREIVSAHGGRIRALGNDDGALLEVVLPAPETTQVEDRPAVAA